MLYPVPRALTDVLRATLSLVDYYGCPVERSLTFCELKRALQASIDELERSIVPRSTGSNPKLPQGQPYLVKMGLR